MGYSYGLKVSPHRTLIITGSRFTMGKPGRHHLNPVNKMNIINNGVNQKIMHPLIGCNERNKA